MDRHRASRDAHAACDEFVQRRFRQRHVAGPDVGKWIAQRRRPGGRIVDLEVFTELVFLPGTVLEGDGKAECRSTTTTPRSLSGTP
jgi:hypothetical protein